MSIEQIRNQVLTDRDDLQDLTVHSRNSHGIEEHHASQQNQPRTLQTFDDFLHQFSADENFTYCKINHAFWEGLSKVYHNLGRDFSKALYRDADNIYGRNNFFSSGFAFDLIDELRRVSPLTEPGLYLGMELSAWSGDQNYMHTPEKPELSAPLFNEFRNMLAHVSSGLILKDAVIDGRIVEFFECLSEKRVLIVGPTYLENLTKIIGGNQVEFLRVPNAESWSFRQSIEDKISDWISQPGSDPSTVLIQCGTVAPFLALRLHRAFPKTRFVDGGLAFSIACPEDLLKRPWGKVFRREIVKTHKKLNTKSEIPEFQRIDFVEKIVATVEQNFPKFSNTETAGKVSFVENKPVNQERISDFLQPSKINNRWSNRGPAWFALAASYEMFFSNLSGKDVIPCANGGIALQAMANLMSLKAGRQLRWCISSFGFSNTSRSPFSNAIFVDCDENGVLDLNEVSRVPAEELDGIVLTNPFGQAKDFTRFADWCKANDKALLIDNAAGIASDIPDLPYQSFSLHHTKPFGFGEGGLAVIPSDERETFLSLMEYTPIETAIANLWITNGKLSDLACASQLARLEASPNWLPLYRLQSERILSIGEKFNFRPLLPIQTPATSVPLLAEFPICRNSLVNDAMVLAKYYKPLASATRCQDIFKRIVNIPAHPDVAQLTNVDIEKLFQKIIDANSDG